MPVTTVVELISGTWESNRQVKRTTTDTDNAFNWTRIEEIIDYHFDYPEPLPQNTKKYFDDGKISTVTYKIFLEVHYKVFPKTEELRDAQGHLISLKRYSFDTRDPGAINVSGAKQTVWDVDGNQGWTTKRLSFDGDGHRLTLVQNNDDGSRVAYQWDPHDRNAFSRVVTRYDAEGSRRSTFYTNDDGSKVLYEQDNAGRTWSQVATYFDADGNRTKAVYDNDDGTHVAYSWEQGRETVTYFDQNWIVI